MPRPLLALVALALLAPGAVAQTPYDSSLFTALTWRNVGPNRGGRSITSAGSPSRPREYYFGATGGGLWKTTDGGLTWRPVTDGKIRSSSVGAVAVSESSPDVVYVGMGETQLRGNIMQGDGVYRSADGGKTWTPAGLAATQAVARIRVDRRNPDLVYVAALGHPYARNEERGVFRSRDGGKTWTRVLFRDAGTGAVDLVIDPNAPSVLYASLWEVYRRPWKLSSGGPGSGLFKSTDGGDSWTELTRNPGMPRGTIGKIGVSVSAADSRRLYAIVEADSGGVFVSDDAGATWRRTNDQRKLRQRAFYYTRIYADPVLRERVYVLNTGFYRSDDGGATFDTTIRVPHGDNHDLWIAPNDNRRMINSNDGGANVSDNAGQSWTDQTFPTAQSYRVALTADLPYHVCGAQQDNSTFCVPSDTSERYLARGRPGDYMYDVGGGESGYIAPHPTNPDVFYAGSQGALLTRYDRRTGHLRDVQVYPRFFSGEAAGTLPERWQWTFPIVFSPRDPSVLYTSSQHLWRTTNEGRSWERISPDLTAAADSTLGDSGGPITKDQNGPEFYATIFTVAPSYFEPGTIWAGSDDGLVHVTRDGGKSWSKVTPPDMPPFSRVSLIEAGRHDAGTAYVCGKRYQLDDRAPYIWRTRDYGRSWTKIIAGIRADDYCHAVREDPARRGLLYAGTEHGVWVSWDDGDRWQPLSRNLPDVQVPDIAVHEKDLVIATHGRSMWVMDDVAPLRQLTPEVATAAVHLFQPADPIRGVYDGVFHYVLKTRADTVRLELLDAQGRTFRTIVGTSGDARADSLERAAANREGAPARIPRKPTTAAGLNRFVWDGRYPGATTFPGMIIWSARPELGPLAPPGRYAVRLTANGVTQTREFALRRDPRVPWTDEDLVAQFRLASEIRDRVTAANEAVIRVRAIRAAVADRAARASDRDVSAAGTALVRDLSAVEEALYQVRNRSGQDPLNFPIKLNNKLAALQRSVETGDGPPSAGARTVFRELSAELDVQLRRLEHTIAERLPPLNARLARKRLPPVNAGAPRRAD
ncbi:MAG TPA: glycosyl hydrolase [Gemmatimonadaceae bacterium]|nr:glycosyl hydrolase [Gemmatimonadaceae bacterium]